jgi:diguanylate cyclase (GGDEF)-like protein
VVRFALLTTCALGLAAAGILLIVRHVNTVEAERSATQQARYAAEAILGGDVRSTDFTTRVGPTRKAQLDSVFEKRILHGSTLAGALLRGDGAVTYATDPGLIRGAGPPAEPVLRDALSGSIVSRVTTLPGPRTGSKRIKVLETLVPVEYPGQRPVVIALYQDYAPIAKAAESAFLPVAGVLEVTLVGLWILLVPALVRATRKLRRHVAEVEHMATHDELTGLPNRSFFSARISESLSWGRRDGKGLAVCLVGLDHFRDVNDTLGNSSGDVVLAELGSRLAEGVRTWDTVARLGGDTFGLLLPGTTQEEAAAAARRIRDIVSRPIPLGEIPVTVDASIGIAFWPHHGADAETLLSRADIAMYVAKERRSGVELYDASRDESDASRLALVTELRGAIDRGQLVLHYQPKADAATGAVRGVEALVRWNHPERGLLPPGEFIPLAERTGLIKPLTRFVLEAAVAQCRRWSERGIEISVAVNMTAIDLLDPALPDVIAKCLVRHGVPAERVEIEITESTIMSEPARVAAVLGRLHEMGLKIAIDDFGSGYTSLGYLRTLPIDGIKIDRSFVTAMTGESRDAAIVHAIVDIGRNLGLEIVAEGVETQEAWDELRRAGCDMVQGYLISRPVPAAEIEALVGSSSSSPRHLAALPPIAAAS